jgi:DNA-directed RNA polymerase subunit RPC12/RpoP
VKIIKIIKDRFIGRVIECIHCGTRQRVTSSDKYREESDRDGNARVYKCAKCKSEIWIDV